MANQAASDFLTKEIKVSGNIVTFRLLSRQLSIHVNDAKRELELFYTASQKSKDPVFATYVLSGAAALDVTPEDATASSNGAPVDASRHLVVLVPEDRLEVAKSRFNGTPAQHVHSLSPVPLKDHGLLTSVTERVRILDIQKGQDHAAQIGMLLSKETSWSGTSKSKSKPKRAVDNPTKPNVLVENPPKKNVILERTSSKTTASIVQSPKELGRQSALNFGGATKKGPSPSTKKEGPGATLKPNTTVDRKPVLSKDSHQAASKAEPPSDSEIPPVTSNNTSPSSAKSSFSKPAQRPTATSGRAKRILDSSDEDEPVPAQPRPAFKRKKSHATSDDDDEDSSGRQSTAARRRSASLEAMMDVDDDGVINGRSARSATPEHVLSTREVAAAAKAAKAEAKAAKAETLKGVDRKEPGPRKRAPKGKKRVIRTRRVKNAKGYMVTEDYSSYEDIDPNETEKNDSGAETEPDREQDAQKEAISRPSTQKVGSTAGSVKKRQSGSTGATKKAKAGTAAKPGQQNLASFFGKK